MFNIKDGFLSISKLNYFSLFSSRIQFIIYQNTFMSETLLQWYNLQTHSQKQTLNYRLWNWGNNPYPQTINSKNIPSQQTYPNNQRQFWDLYKQNPKATEAASPWSEFWLAMWAYKSETTFLQISTTANELLDGKVD